MQSTYVSDNGALFECHCGWSCMQQPTLWGCGWEWIGQLCICSCLLSANFSTISSFLLAPRQLPTWRQNAFISAWDVSVFSSLLELVISQLSSSWSRAHPGVKKMWNFVVVGSLRGCHYKCLWLPAEALCPSAFWKKWCLHECGALCASWSACSQTATLMSATRRVSVISFNVTFVVSAMILSPLLANFMQLFPSMIPLKYTRISTPTFFNKLMISLLEWSLCFSRGSSL